MSAVCKQLAAIPSILATDATAWHTGTHVPACNTHKSDSDNQVVLQLETKHYAAQQVNF
jgi:hypothetical protein